MSWRLPRLGVSAKRMSEANIDFAVIETDTSVPAEEAVDDLLLTKRLPPITPPPMRPSSAPPPGGAFTASGTFPTEIAGPQSRPSWWQALLSVTSAPPSLSPAPTDERVLRRRIGATCAGMAIGFVILALALGLRGVEPSYSPTVSAALILARALVALGFLGFGYGLLRMAERLFSRGGASSADLG
jgi:hypothetical protein